MGLTRFLVSANPSFSEIIVSIKGTIAILCLARTVELVERLLKGLNVNVIYPSFTEHFVNIKSTCVRVRLAGPMEFVINMEIRGSVFVKRVFLGKLVSTKSMNAFQILV